jgi:hypothetical protein
VGQLARQPDSVETSQASPMAQPRANLVAQLLYAAVAVGAVIMMFT